MLCVLTHQGIGDHIICNGLVRSLLKEHNSLILFVKNKNFHIIQRMYVDEPRIFCTPMPDNEEAFFDFVSKNHLTLKVGFSKYWDLIYKSLEVKEDLVEQKFDLNFYKLANIPYENRWSEFYIQRDFDDELKVLQKYEAYREPYIFVHDDIDRGFYLEPHNPNNYRIIKNDKTESIFSMIGLLENAAEIHCMESSFNPLIEHLNKISDDKLFYYPNVRKYPYWLIANTKRNWNVIL